MDDLSGLDWNNSNKPPAKSASPLYPSYPSLQPSSTASSGTSTPILRPSSSLSSQPQRKIGSKPPTPANDSFASLLGGQAKQSGGISLQERQRQILEEKAKKAQQIDSHFGVISPSLNSNDARSIASAPRPPSRPLSSNTGPRTDVDDILAAFNSSVKVDSSSHFPPSNSSNGGRGTPSIAVAKPAPTSNLNYDEGDDDPFGLNQLPKRPIASSSTAPTNDDDILGMLGRPAEEFAAQKQPTRQRGPLSASSSSDEDVERSAADAAVAAVAELVDMGFSANKAAIALAQTESGHDVQAAVGILLQQAHDESRQKSRHQNEGSKDQSTRDRERDTSSSRRLPAQEAVPSWMRTDKDDSRSTSRNQSQNETRDKDVSQYASEIGTSFLKSANSLWKTGQKKVQRAMADLQQESDANQPKWMRDAQASETKSKARLPDVTDEAMQLESNNGRPQPPSRSSVPRIANGDNDLPSRPNFKNPFEQRQPGQNQRNQSDRAATRLTRHELKNNSGEAYISPARRRKPQQTPSTSSILEPSPPASQRQKSPLSPPVVQSKNPFSSIAKPPIKTTSSPAPVRPRAPPRQIPPASSAALASSASHRQRGTEFFKRGDFSTAHTSYSSALQSLPSQHPVTIVVFCNRSLTNLKNGDPKAALADADSALEVIGISRGEGEKINLGSGEGEKDMKEFYGKALMRKAEALENMEKWSDAAKVWRDAVEANVGGSVSIQGRNRCEKAADGGQTVAKKAASAASRPAQKPRPRPVTNTAQSAEAVRKLREANAAAEKADDEKFALTDQVDAKLVAWKGSKAENLRALLGSLDKVLWPEAGWKQVGMQDLIMANRVKIIYMKAIAKVHPDKIATNATTEQRMISAAVFSTLNEAWDKFKAENNL